MKHRTPCKQIFCRLTYTQLMGGVKGSNYFLPKKVMLHIKKISFEHFTSKMFDFSHTPDLLGRVEKVRHDKCILSYTQD